jgi:DNA repair protein RadA/Sms
MYQCAACGWLASWQYVHCQDCGAGPGAMLPLDPRRSDGSQSPVDKPVDIPRLGESAGPPVARHPTGVFAVDQALGGGLVAGQTILLAGEPGAGKTTLALLAAERYAGDQALYVTAEETIDQVQDRYVRLGVTQIRAVHDNDPVRIEELAHRHARALLVVDSLNRLVDPQLDGAPGSPSQIKNAATILAERWAKSTGVPVILIGHLTWKDRFQGPRTVEHMVDTVWYYERTDDDTVRALDVTKCRWAGARRWRIALEDLA